jgi:membrane fusion protein (multidrug efflux system)
MTAPRPATLTALAAALLVAAAAFFSLALARHDSGTDNAFVDGDVTPISTRIAGHVVKVGVRDHQRVAAGDLLYRIDDADYRARVAQAQAELAGRVSALAVLEEDIALQDAAIAQAQAALRGAGASADRARRDHLRNAGLKDGGWVSQARLDQVWAARAEASAELDRAEAALSAARQRRDVIRSQRATLQAARDSALAALGLAEVDLQSTQVRAPAAGVVGERRVRVGQYVRPGSELIALVSDRPWITANFKETQLASVAPGRRVRVSVDAAPGLVFQGVVQSLSPASGAQFALLAPDNATGNFTRIVQRVPVKIALEPDQPASARLRPGMSARVSLLD